MQAPETNDDEAAFARGLAVIRRDRDISQAELSTRLAEDGMRIDPTAISRIENGGRALRFNEAQAIARATGASVDTIMRAGQYKTDTEAAEAKIEAIIFVRDCAARALKPAREELKAAKAGTGGPLSPTVRVWLDMAGFVRRYDEALRDYQ